MLRQSLPKRSTRSHLHVVTSAVLVAAVVCVATPADAADKQAKNRQMSDANISQAIEREIITSRGVILSDINLSVTNGHATLSGTVNNLLAKDRAERIAETVKGVRSVSNLIAVKPSESRTDDAIRKDVQAALLADPATDSYEVNVTVQDGTVTLTGQTESWQERELSGIVAKGVRGVTDLTNSIRVTFEDDRPDTEIASDIQQAMLWDTRLDHALISVNVNDGKVTLSGTVGSAAEKRRAEYTAWIAGVSDVDSKGLKVERWARDEDLRSEKYVTRSPSDTVDAIENALLLDPRVLSVNVTPTVVGSTATLRGTVDNLSAKYAAADIARNVIGVSYVDNQLSVRPAMNRTDSAIRTDIHSALLRDPYVNRYDISIAVDDGEATLTGTVDSYFEQAQAYSLASRVNGVIEVHNNLAVEDMSPLAYDPYLYDPYITTWTWYDYEPATTTKSDSEIKDEIEDELWWSPFVDSDAVTVTVDNGEATLRGTLSSWSEVSSAIENAYEGGATSVDSQLNVNSGEDRDT